MRGLYVFKKKTENENTKSEDQTKITSSTSQNFFSQNNASGILVSPVQAHHEVYDRGKTPNPKKRENNALEWKPF
jgi:hypothetical protein